MSKIGQLYYKLMTKRRNVRQLLLKTRDEYMVLWRNRDFMLLCSGQAISLIGNQVSQLALLLLILALTGSPAQAGLIASLRTLPYVLLGLPAGALIDRWDRKRVMIICDIGRALNMASIVFALAISQLTIVQLYLVSLIEGIFFLFFNIAEATCIPRLVTEEQLTPATAQNEIMYGLSLFLGPPLGGILLGIQRVFPFLTDAVSYIVSILSLLCIRSKFQEERQVIRTGSLYREIIEGLIWLWRQPNIRFITLLTAGYNFIIACMPLLLIILAQKSHSSPFEIGLLLGFPCVGGLVGALTITTIQRQFGFGPTVIGIAWLLALIWPLYAIAPNLIILGMITTGLFTLLAMYDIVQFSYRLALTPDMLQGRIISIFRIGLFASQSLGLGLTGGLILYAGPVATILLFSIGLFILALATLFSFSSH